MIKLSVNMITQNGETLIKKALLSVLPYCNEAIVCDTGSTDRTVEILKDLQKQYPHLQYRVQNTQDPAALIVILNDLKHRSSFPWILRIDDDEVFPKETMEEVQNIKEDVVSYSFPFLHYEDEHFINPAAHSPQRPGFFVVRLFKNVREINWVNNFGREVLAYNRLRISSRARQVAYCRKLRNPFLHLGELRQGKRKHEYTFHQRGHCALPLGKYEEYIR